METSPRKVASRPPRFIEAIVEALVPYTYREALMGDFAEDYESVPQFLRHTSRIVFRMVANQVRSTVHFGLAGAQACALYIAFSAASISLRALIVVAVALSVLVLRNAHRYPANGSPQETALDTIIAVTFGFFSQAFIGLFAPSLTLPVEIMMRGAVMSPLLICTLRMMFGGHDRPPEDLRERSSQAFRATWAMNILWLIAFLSLIVTNTEAIPASVQGRDFLFTFAPIAVFFLIYRLQMNVLSGSAPSLSHRHRDELLRKRDTLWGSDRTRSSTWYACAEALFFAVLALPLCIAVWSGVFGHGANVDWIRVWTNLTALLILALVWIYIRQSNRNTARVLQEEIDALDNRRKA